MLRYIEIRSSGKALTYGRSIMQFRLDQTGWVISCFSQTQKWEPGIFWGYTCRRMLSRRHSKQCMQPLHARTEIGTSDYNHKERHHRLPEERGSLWLAPKDKRQLLKEEKGCHEYHKVRQPEGSCSQIHARKTIILRTAGLHAWLGDKKECKGLRGCQTADKHPWNRFLSCNPAVLPISAI